MIKPDEIIIYLIKQNEEGEILELITLMQLK